MYMLLDKCWSFAVDSTSRGGQARKCHPGAVQRVSYVAAAAVPQRLDGDAECQHTAWLSFGALACPPLQAVLMSVNRPVARDKKAEVQTQQRRRAR